MQRSHHPLSGRVRQTAVAVATATAVAVAVMVPVCSRPPPAWAGLTEPVALIFGCNAVALTWPTGTPPETVVAALAPTPARVTLWRFDNPTKTFRAYAPAVPAARDLWWLRTLDAVFLCVDHPTTLTRPLMVHPAR